MEKLSKILLVHYYCTFIWAMIAATLGYLCKINAWWSIESQSSAGLAIYSCIILYVLCTTPLVLKVFSKFVDKINAKHAQNDELRYKAYKHLVQIRLLIVVLGMIASLIFCYVMNNRSLIWLAAISAITLYFCKPTKAKTEADLAIEQTQDEVSEDKQK